ncbi:serine integrase [Streptomyces phage Ignacio]|uniref:Serine integrase n=4 Tax=Ignaciovirus TaxID=3152509 RepID=A0A7D5JKB6_9CAUD|nr:serine integrase [Streptomyces phage Ignacio]YP_010756208.1 serine integrase [Streptomyces phage Eklok]YP_010756265.1 serine integrase [Streptomyces phage AxeJC]YP_010756498.1 serine integrase [Streptomyces phage Piccadilly]YP_010756556.1 serine integrase [Streptomyces phage Eastland]QKN87557.1 serine integrase [Streptomyces phage Ignacio]QLF83214.1 serine integrase [Streptomyces phage Eklok]UJQ86040.1 serine integrase [Streptomyces phage Piccadilly]URC17951.1 serine integrase [Streptomy
MISEPEPYIGYIRVSMWREEAISPELQRTAIQAWATRTGRRIIDWVIDLDKTGRNFKRRIMGAIERVERSEARGIAVWKYSRFGRTDSGIAVNLARIEHVGGQLQSATEEIDARTAVGKFYRKILFDLAVFESDRAGEQWKETHQWRRDHGLPATGGNRLGYIWTPRRIPAPDRPGQWIIQDERYDPDPAAVGDVKELFSRKTYGRAGYGALAGWLNELGHTTSRGRPWETSSLRRYMDAGFAAGLLRIHDPACGCDYTAANHGCRRNRWTYIPAAHPAIISPDLWEAYTTHRAEQRARTPRSRNPVYPLTGLMRCGTCRRDVGATSARRRGKQVLGYAYSCASQYKSGTTICTSGVWVQRAVVEDEVLRWLETEAAPGIDAAPPTATTPPVDRTKADAARAHAHALAQHEKVTTALQRLAVAAAMDPDRFPPGVFEAARDQLVAEQQQWAREMQKYQQIEAAPTRATFEPVAVGLVAEWDVLNVSEKNALLRRLLRRVVVTREGRGSSMTRVECHPVWDPDPWSA